jgi:plasmid stabilization system protein ParE
MFYLKEIVDYYKEVAGVKVANNLKNKLLRATQKLSTLPDIGVPEEFDIHEYRSLILDNYKIIYRVEPPYVYVIDVFDTRQGPEKIKRNL